MTSSEAEMFDSRLISLERARTCLWVVLTCIASALITAVTLGAGARDAPLKAVEAKEFVIVDEKGRTLIRIGPDAEGTHRAVVEFLDNDGQRRILLGIDNNGAPGISLIDPEDGKLVVLDIPRKSGGALAFRDREAKSGILLGSGPAGVSALGFMGDDGRAHIQIGLKPDGSGQVTVLDRLGNISFRTPQ